jgi:hypothetical protein
MSWWDDFSNAVSSAVDAAADVVEGVVNAAGDAAADVVETAGNLAQDGLNALGDALGGIPVVGGFLKGAMSWLGGVVSGASNFFGAIVKAQMGALGGVLAGVIRILGGLVALNPGLMLKGFLDIVSSIAGGIVLVSGQLLSHVQRAFFLQSADRPLTKEERERLRRVFGPSLALYNIHIIEGWSGAFGITPNAFTLGNTIYMKDRYAVVGPSLLVHEAVHVWQYQNVGARYTTDALGAQFFMDDAYDWQAELDRGLTRWWDFNKESQAEFMQDVWVVGTLTTGGATTGPGGGVFFDLQEAQETDSAASALFVVAGTDHTAFAHDSIAAMRGRINARASRFA